MGLFRKKTDNNHTRPFTAAVIPAAGSSSRMDGVNKLFVEIVGVPVIAHTLLAFQHAPQIDEIVITTSSDSILPMGDIVKNYGITKVSTILCGGATRTESVYAGLLNVDPRAEYVAIHDGARPLVTATIIEELLACAIKHGAAVPIVPLKDTVKRMDGTVVLSTPDRATLGAVQTPQVFQLGLIKGALTKAMTEKWKLTDDASALEQMGMKIQSVAGRHDNLKITTPEDVVIAEALLLLRGQTL